MKELTKETFMTVRELAEVFGVSTDTVKNCIRRIMPKKLQNGKTTYLNEKEVACISKELKNNNKVVEKLTYETASRVKNTTTELEVLGVPKQKQQNWYTIEELASLCGFSIETLKKGNSPLNELSIDFKVDTRLGGYHNTKKFYSENVLKALKEYQIKNSTPNAVKEKSTVIEGNVNFTQTDTFNKTIQGLLDNPDALLCLINESSKRIQALNTKLIEQQPKADYYDKFIDSTNLIEIGHLGKSTKIGEQKIFKKLVAEGYIKVRYSTDGVKYYDPCCKYDKYFKSVSVPFLRGEKQLNREKLMLTSEGYAFFMKKMGGF